MLEIRGLEKRYGDVLALRGLDLTVQPGEVYGFLGRNGAGKTTTIRILMGITHASAGTFRIFEDSSRDLLKLRQRIGYVAQEQNFYGSDEPARPRAVRGRLLPDVERRRVPADFSMGSTCRRTARRSRSRAA